MSMQTSDQYGPAPASKAAAPDVQRQPRQQTQAIPFVRASRKASQQDFAVTGITLGAAQQQIGPFDIQTNGFLRYVDLLVNQTTAGNAAAVVFAQDGPFSALQNVTLQDPSSEFVISPYSGWELAMMEKYGGYVEPPYSDPRSDPNYIAKVVGGGDIATDGSFQFITHVPLEDRTRDAFCSVPNSAANKQYRLQAFIGTEAQVFTTPPTVEPTGLAGEVPLAVRCTNFYWTEPPASIAGTPTVPTPNGNGSVAYLDREVFTGITSMANPTLILRNVGRVYKVVVFVNRAAAAARDDVTWPDPATLWVNGFPLYYKPQAEWEKQMRVEYGYGNPQVNTLLAPPLGSITARTPAVEPFKEGAGRLDTGVYVWSDLISQPGHATNWGPTDQVLPTVASTKVQIQGTWGAAATELDVLQRTIKPASGAALFS